VKTPFSLIQMDVQDIRVKESLGTQPTTHLRRHHRPRYQWTACAGRTRLRFLAFRQHLNRTCGLAFLLLVLRWLRASGVETLLAFQTDWGQEFGGDSPQPVAGRSRRFLQLLGGERQRYPLGRKGQRSGGTPSSHRR
jgi:hypothetical protein